MGGVQSPAFQTLLGRVASAQPRGPPSPPLGPRAVVVIGSALIIYTAAQIKIGNPVRRPPACLWAGFAVQTTSVAPRSTANFPRRGIRWEIVLESQGSGIVSKWTSQGRPIRFQDRASSFSI